MRRMFSPPAFNHIIVIVGVLFASCHAFAGTIENPVFSKSFEPDIIGPDSVSELTFSIDNSQVTEPFDGLAFTDTLPTDMTLAAPAIKENTCGGTLTAPDGGSTITLADGQVGAHQSCTVSVFVTAEADDDSDTSYENTSGPLSWTGGEGGTAGDTLDVDIDRPGFSKSFDPSTVSIGGRSTLTFTIDNSLNGSSGFFLNFLDNLPAGMVVADPPNVSSDCNHSSSPEVTAVAGTDFISLSGGGVDDFDSCSVTVDVIGGAIGSLNNVSGEFRSSFSGSEVVSGKAAAVLEVTGFEGLLELSKEFTDDPVPPGGTTTLEFTVTNKSRTDSATGITFDDDLEATLAGLTPTLPGNPDPPCGAGSSLAFNAGELTLSGGNLLPENSCTFSVELTAHPDSADGAYPNTAGPVSGGVGGSPETGNTASDVLFVVSYPILTKEFTDDPVAAGDSVTLEFTITNTDSSSTISDITFSDELTGGSGDSEGTTGFLPFPVSVTLPPVPDPPCGPGSSLSLEIFGEDRQGLVLTNGSLDEAGMAGDSCTFQVTVDIPLGLPGGIYTNITEEITAAQDDVAGTPTVIGPPASDELLVVSAPQLIKEFLDDPVLPSGGPVTLQFELSYNVEEGTPDATAIAFTDDLTGMFSGLVAASVDTNTCAGSTVDITTDPTMIDFSGGTLAAGEDCNVSLTLTVPAASPIGFHTNTTSDVTASVGGGSAANLGATDNLLITSLVFTKQFNDDPVIPGDTVTLQFSLENISPTDEATMIRFLDNLDTVLENLAPTGLPINDVCGSGSSLSQTVYGGDTFLVFTDDSLAAGVTCTFSVELDVPAATSDGDYPNRTSVDFDGESPAGLAAKIGGASVSTLFPPATDELDIRSEWLEMTKAFTDDPVQPGDTVTLEFTLENLSGSETVTDIAFDDDLDAALAGLKAVGATVNTCGGIGSSFPAGLFEYSGGTLSPGATCEIVLDVEVPPGPLPGGLFPNTTTDVTGKIGALDVFGSAASDELIVQLFEFSKSFDGPAFGGDDAVLSFTLTNWGGDEITELAFSDDLDAVISGLAATGLPMVDVCGSGSTLSGTSFLTLIGASLPASGGTCSFDVDVAIPSMVAAGSYVNTTSELLQYGLPLAIPATALLSIEPPPDFIKTFSPDIVSSVTDVSMLTFSIDNSASALVASALDFTDNLPAGVTVATPPGAATTCTGGTLTAIAGSAVIAYTGGEVGAGASCSVSVDTVSSTAGVHVNLTGDLTSTSGNSGTATDSLTVSDADGDGLLDGDDNCPFDANPGQKDLDSDGDGDVCDLDTDGDGMPDDWESDNGLDPFNSFDQIADNDGDGFTNLQEFEFGTDPNVPDADDNENGIPDSVEMEAGQPVIIVPTILFPLILY